jgi:5'-nucleotidase
VRRTRPLCILLLLVGCGSEAREPELHGPLSLVLLHTADTHSELFPWRTVLGSADARRGLGVAQSEVEVGGFARLATLLKAERARAPRALQLDAGDLFQGSLAFERFGGEPEVLAFDALGVDAQTLGNHELDRGVELVHERYRTLAHFPLLAANYVADGTNGLADVLQPFVVLAAKGLRVGVIGVGNTSTVALLKSRPNELGELAEDAASSVQRGLDVLRPLVDLVVVVTHLGLDADERLVRATSGIDVVLGGHQHLTLDEPEWVEDCGGGGEPVIHDGWGRERRCAPRRVPIVHSGAYGKYVGRLTLALDDEPAELGATYDPLDRYEVVGADFVLVPVRADTPDDPSVAELLEPYRPEPGDVLAALDVLADAPEPLERNGATGGDSPLGNLVSEAARAVAEADLAVIGASSLRHDLPPGALDLETLVRVLPFEDPVVRVELTGAALGRIFEHAARTAESRECRTPVHVAGALVRFGCPCAAGPCALVFAPQTDVPCAADADCASMGGACGARDGRIGSCFAALDEHAVLGVATTDYLADGGGGLVDAVLPYARVRVADGLSAAVSEFVHQGAPCANAASDACKRGCAADLVQRATETCATRGSGSTCAEPHDLCSRAIAACRYVPCLDASAGAARDGRIRFEEP